MCYHSQTAKTEDTFSSINFQAILPPLDCSDQVEYLVVLDIEEESENPENKTCEERQVTDQNSSDQKIWSKNNITDHKCKYPALSHNCHDSDAKATSEHFNTYSMPQQKPDIYQNGPWVKPHKNMTRSSQTSHTCSVEQNEVGIAPDGLMEYAVQNQKADCKQNLTIEPEEDYSKVSGIYRETVLVIEKDSSPVQRHQKRIGDDPKIKTETEKPSSDKDFTNTQGYVTTLQDMFELGNLSQNVQSVQLCEHFSTLLLVMQ